MDVNGVIAANPTWEAAKRLKLQNWNTGRNILTYKATAAFESRGVAFRWPANPASPTATEIDATQAAALDKNASGTTDGNGATRLAYLRGDDSKEQQVCPTCTPQFRSRSKGLLGDKGPLGDIVNSAPVYVAAPSFGYASDFETASYGSFAALYKDRKKVVYVGANDGMLHAFDAASGDELLAYVPAAVYGSLSQLSSTSYTHRYTVDGTPTVGDVFYGGAWHTLLVSECAPARRACSPLT